MNEAQTQTSLLSIELSSTRSKDNYSLLLINNNYLFKSYLLIKLLKYKTPKLNQHELVYEQLEDKLLVKIIDICLENASSKEYTCILKRIFLHLYEEYLKQDTRFILKSKTSFTNIQNSDEFLNELPDLIDQIKTNLKQPTTSQFDKCVSYLDFLPLKLRTLIQGLLNSKAILNNLIKSILETNANSKIFHLLGGLIGVNDTNSLVQVYEPMFDKKYQNKLDNLILNILSKVLSLAKSEFEMDCYLNEQDMCRDNFKRLLDDMQKLIESNRNCLVYPGRIKYKVFNSKSLDSLEEKESKRKLEPVESDSLVDLTKFKRIRRVSSSSLPVDSFLPESSSSSSSSYESLISNYEDLNNKQHKLKLDLLKSPLTYPVHTLPGIGKIYAERLKERKIYKVGDLVSFYEKKCECNKQKFENELKSIAFMRQDSMTKLIDFIETLIRKNLTQKQF